MNILGIRKCANCGKDVEIYHRKRLEADEVCCSTECINELKKKRNVNYPQRSFQFVKNNNNEVKILPSRNTAFSAGYDFVSPIDITIKPNEIAKISTGVKAIMLPDEFLMLTVRSSLGTKRNLRMATGTSIVDADYACNPDNDGDIIIPLYNYGKEDQVIQAGERIAQGVFIKYLSTDNDHSENERTGGFGSTGTK